jgi:hypothetical protein
VDLYGGKRLKQMVARLFMRYVERYHARHDRGDRRRGLPAAGDSSGSCTRECAAIWATATRWRGLALNREILELIHSGTNNIVCTQPFGCLPKPRGGQGYDPAAEGRIPLLQYRGHRLRPGATKINQENGLS